MGVDNFVWVHVGQLDGLPDLALQALGSSPGHRELDGLGVPGVLWVAWVVMSWLEHNLFLFGYQ